MGRTCKKRLVVVGALAPVALGFLGLLSLDVMLRLGASSRGAAPREQDVVTRVRISQTLADLVSSGSRESHEQQWQTARWLADRCADLGYVVEVQDYEEEGESWPNVIASRVPLSVEREHVVAMAHLDSISDDPQDRAPGADDNGSGVAVLLEVARRLRAIETPLPVAFCFFSNEETGVLGGKDFAGRAKRQSLRLRAAVNVDVVGYNRPERLMDWSAVAAQESWREKGRAVWFQVGNGMKALRNGPDTLLVAGRPPNRQLVNRVGDALERVSGLFVVREVDDDCG
jgi:hypothetical protein